MKFFTVWTQPWHKGLSFFFFSHFCCCITSYCQHKGLHSTHWSSQSSARRPCLNSFLTAFHSGQPGLWGQRQLEKMQSQVRVGVRIHLLEVLTLRFHSFAGCGFGANHSSQTWQVPAGQWDSVSQVWEDSLMWWVESRSGIFLRR